MLDISARIHQIEMHKLNHMRLDNDYTQRHTGISTSIIAFIDSVLHLQMAKFVFEWRALRNDSMYINYSLLPATITRENRAL